ncbi:TIGR02710 family CRISPR-associated protein [Candidatus Bathyarchaeota archaeon]|nr:TIGR02710 family CRISPR-associated protein [Candidatus Bathyarchaeota archaeon]
MRPRALIATVGLSEEPIEFSAQKYQPETVYLICTNESLATAKQIERRLKKTAACQTIVIPNGSESSQVMRQIYRVCEDLQRSGVDKSRILVDGTGGTKPMSAGAMIAAAVLGLTNLYVEVRRDGEGRVIPETMRVYELPDPREVLAEYYAELGIHELNKGEFTTARAVFKRLREETSSLKRRKLWEAFEILSEALDAYDKFSHQEAASRLDAAIGSLQEYQRDSRPQRMEELICSLEIFKERLARIVQPEAGLERVLDLFANAHRRLVLARYDDAVARYYRALEALAHLALKKDCGYSEERIKEERLSLEKSYELLLGLNHPLGLRFKEDGGVESAKGRFRGMLEARNSSILAHGWRPVRVENARKFADFVEHYLEVYCRLKGISLREALSGHECPSLPPIRNLLYG